MKRNYVRQYSENPAAIRWAWREDAVGGGYVGQVELYDGALTATAPGDSKGQAIARAAQLAENMLENPILAALVPPQAKLALAVAKKLGVAQHAGKLASVTSKIVGPGAKRLAKALKFW